MKFYTPYTKGKKAVRFIYVLSLLEKLFRALTED